MVYIRAKRLKSDQYLYLVKSVWDSEKKTSKQEIVKYLGKASKVTEKDVPAPYRDDPKVLSVLAAHSPEDAEKKEKLTVQTKQKMYKELINGDIQKCIKIYNQYVDVFAVEDFFDKILRPVMHKIGDDWFNDRISIATEHVASNIAQALIRVIMQQTANTKDKIKVLLCVPVGEEHHLGCDVLETYLAIKGFKVYNMETSIPTESILDFIKVNRPDVVLVSITIEDNLAAGKRLVRKICDRYDVPVMVGGYAVQANKTPDFDGMVIDDIKLGDVPRLLKSAARR